MPATPVPAPPDPAAAKREEAGTLAREARDNADRQPGHARIVAMWAGIAARDAAMAETDNPFPPPERSELRLAWAEGFAMRRQTPLPRARTIRLPAATQTHASATHDALP
ncbi:MAG: hypothetical protein HQL41_05940 [Alphaproteobacteria bacterium]|nr:hypothetical protein [Alphaproteobacteria bacterium]